MNCTIITCTFNSERTLRGTLESVCSQRISDIEHLIIDGGSTDGTLAIVGEFTHVAGLISEPDKGLYDAMNKGIARATGEVIGIGAKSGIKGRGLRLRGGGQQERRGEQQAGGGGDSGN